jgi:ABC-type dipeptide/oligopeptide/nickel transport system permease component
MVAPLIMVKVSVTVGVIEAAKRYLLVDNFATFTALVGQAMPLDWFGIMLVIIFGVWLRYRRFQAPDPGNTWVCRGSPWAPGSRPSTSV